MPRSAGHRCDHIKPATCSLKLPTKGIIVSGCLLTAAREHAMDAVTIRRPIALGDEST
jgi:hypothetical protein